ncbi:hypothetical protein IMG5_100380 [Ichthyophthirius multifiliis]|uniref:Uncharacterized protein n=1 Tax=Ichthyophthirius multifiliis TaxID=5932 RepID=G0QSE2_ICHMU|nr:hypothetical protein IMG5_100380 [Ichthyophthirius multifiliis]EGR31889.1 hypothetical protein IMG5_100380 [Ichthyophthirius multifiliis]|eukprot:XP_004035375.1 hypothetical protein IMG5_100380 [Ichthyophthirius multifiliis]
MQIGKQNQQKQQDESEIIKRSKNVVRQSFTDNIDEIIRKSQQTTNTTVADYIPQYNPNQVSETIEVVQEFVQVKKKY